MNNDLLFDGKTYISVGRASKKLGYTADYIGQLCRAGKIDARMIGRTWYVEWESVKNHKKSKKHRIRRTAEEIRKAREMESFGNLSQTTSLEVENEKDKDCPPDEYLEKVNRENKKEVPTLPVFSESFLPQLKKKDVVVEKNVDDCPPDEYLKKIDEALPLTYTPLENVIVTEEIVPQVEQEISKVIPSPVVLPQVPQQVVSIYHPNHYVAFALGLFVFFNLIFIGMNIVSPEKTTNLLSALSNIELPFTSRNNSVALETNYSNKNIENTSSIYGGIKDVFDFLFGGIKDRINRYAISYMKSLGFATKEIENPAPKTPVKTGMVVAPDVKDHEKTVASIKNTFSDEVSVVPDADEQSGVIVPHFKEVDGDTYTYVLIPINSP